jgi:hypothetical protein
VTEGDWVFARGDKNGGLSRWTPCADLASAESVAPATMVVVPIPCGSTRRSELLYPHPISRDTRSQN